MAFAAQWALFFLLVVITDNHSTGFLTHMAIDPETRMNVPEIIAYHGYPVEEHFITTEDGYILGVHRIPGGRNERASSRKPVAFLQHGLLCSSADWILNLVNESLAFLLADAGFDVWLGNSRGNDYSKAHTHFKVDSDEFWAFSWDEMAYYDLPAVINHIVNTTGQEELFYVGHSQGTMIAFAHFSEDQELAKRIKKFYALGPVTTLKYMESPLKYLASIVPEVKFLFKLFGVRDFLPNSKIIKWLAKHICTLSLGEEICANIVFLICGYDEAQMNKTRLDVYTTHTPAGTSVQNLVHYAQAYESGRFRKFDYGREGNLKHYHKSYAPEYDLHKFKVPTVLYSGGKDLLADPDDVALLLKTLDPNVVKKHKQISFWMHLDFIWGMDAATLIYREIIDDMRHMGHG